MGEGSGCEDPPLFRCDWPNIKDTVVWDVFSMVVKTMGTPGGGGFPKYFRDNFAILADQAKDVLNIKLPPKFVVDLISKMIALQLALRPGSVVDLKFLPAAARIVVKDHSQFDATFSKAFVDGMVGEGFDHATALAKITQPMLFLHANWFMYKERLLGALNDDDVARVKSLVKGSWKYVRMNCAHFIPLEAPDQESKEITGWVDEYLINQS